MASSMAPSFSSLNRPFCSHRINLKPPQALIRSQIFRSSDEGKSANIVDANLKVLRERIEEVRRKERLEKSCLLSNKINNNIGWNYYSNSNNNINNVIGCKHKRNIGLALATDSLELMGLVSAAIGLVFLGGTLCICLVSLIVQLSKMN